MTFRRQGLGLQCPLLDRQLARASPSVGRGTYLCVFVSGDTQSPAHLLSLSCPGGSQAGRSRRHTDHRRLSERGRVQQEPRRPAAAGPELQGELPAAREPGLLWMTLTALRGPGAGIIRLRLITQAPMECAQAPMLQVCTHTHQHTRIWFLSHKWMACV